MPKNKKILILIFVFFITIISGYFIYTSGKKPSAEQAAKQNPAKNDAPANNISPPSSTNGGKNSDTANPPTPILIKSSGNNGSVPSGAIIEFVCQTDTATNCTIELTNQSSKKVVDLKQKLTISDRQPHFAAFWTWTAAAGTWTVVARTSNGNLTSSSAQQTLEVK